MYMFAKHILAGFMVLLITMGAPWAQTGAPLTEREIKGFAASMPEIMPLGEKYDIGDPDMEKTAGNFEKFYLDAVTRVRAKGGYGELRGLVRRHGFTSPERWAEVGGRVMKAYMGIAMGEQQPKAAAQMEQAIRRMKSNTSMPPAQREQMLAAMRKSAAMMKAMTSNISKADTDAIRPHMKTLTKTMEEN